MFDYQKVPNEPVSDFVIGFGLLGLFRISIFGFRFLFWWRLGAINFVEVILLNIEKVRF